jgi:hypothetical protein
MNIDGTLPMARQKNGVVFDIPVQPSSQDEIEVAH